MTQVEVFTPGMRPHRGTMLLVFSILSWVVCIIFGVCAYFMAKSDLAEMDAGRMDPSGRGTVQAAKIVSLIHIIVAGVSIVLSILFFVGLLILGAIGAASGGGGY